MSNSIQILGPRGNSLAVEAAGEGPTLFLLHGFPLDHRLWQHQLKGLCEHLHVVAVHLRGFGHSSLDEPKFTMAELAQDVDFLRKHLAGDGKIFLGGLSMGGYVALEYWRQFAEHLRGLILCNTKPTADNEAAKNTRKAMAARALEQGTWAAVEPMFKKVLAPKSIESQPETARVVESMMKAVSPATIAAAQNAMAERRDFSDQLSAIRCPTLVIAGDADPIAPAEDAKSWASHIPGARLEVIADTAHLSPLESPAAVNDVLLQFVRG